MSTVTEELFREDSYLEGCAARVTATRPGAIRLDRTVFYPTGGGQPGDTGLLRFDGQEIRIVDTVKGEEPRSIDHIIPVDAPLPAVGAEVDVALDFDRRHRLMRMHTCLHLLCKAVDGSVTGGSVGDGKGRLDFDIPEPDLDKEALTETLNQWIGEDHSVRFFWIDDSEFDARPDLVKTMSVQPPRGSGRVRLVEIEGLDLQACGGTHVRFTGEIGKVRVAKIEKKGRQNRRVQVVFDEG
ncbi:MAG: alanyl-tRNA editing protein [Geminicoccaceae bacterium]